MSHSVTKKRENHRKVGEYSNTRAYSETDPQSTRNSHLDAAALVLRPGDSVVFDSHIPHRTLNTGIIPMRAVWANFQSASEREEPTTEPVPSKGRRR